MRLFVNFFDHLSLRDTVFVHEFKRMRADFQRDYYKINKKLS